MLLFHLNGAAQNNHHADLFVVDTLFPTGMTGYASSAEFSQSSQLNESALIAVLPDWKDKKQVDSLSFLIMDLRSLKKEIIHVPCHFPEMFHFSPRYVITNEERIVICSYKSLIEFRYQPRLQVIQLVRFIPTDVSFDYGSFIGRDSLFLAIAYDADPRGQALQAGMFVYSLTQYAFLNTKKLNLNGLQLTHFNRNSWFAVWGKAIVMVDPVEYKLKIWDYDLTLSEEISGHPDTWIPFSAARVPENMRGREYAFPKRLIQELGNYVDSINFIRKIFPLTTDSLLVFYASPEKGMGALTIDVWVRVNGRLTFTKSYAERADPELKQKIMEKGYISKADFFYPLRNDFQVNGHLLVTSEVSPCCFRYNLKTETSQQYYSDCMKKMPQLNLLVYRIR